jgi:hypothetical protein
MSYVLFSAQYFRLQQWDGFSFIEWKAAHLFQLKYSVCSILIDAHAKSA